MSSYQYLIAFVILCIIIMLILLFTREPTYFDKYYPPSEHKTGRYLSPILWNPY